MKHMSRNNPRKKSLGRSYPHLWEVLLEVACQHPLKLEINRNPNVSNVSVKWALDNKLTRKVVKRSNFRMTGKFPSAKCVRMVQWESELELQAIRLLELFPQVTHFREQPAEILYIDQEGKERSHFPDLLVVMKSGLKLILEIKTDHESLDEMVTTRARLLAEALRPMGICYMVIAESQLGGVRQENAKTVLRMSPLRTPIDAITVEMTRKILQRPESQSLEGAIKSLSGSNTNSRSVIYTMIRKGRLKFDMSLPLSGTTQVHFVEGYRHG